ncbi:aldose epimerase family protein [Lentilactobacillus hilgardii]|uniref:aldose epimerase family protein n=1 Tax=Lentilactobacillus hilgardii TaxID=1588 RepID=UPI0021A65236|nr:aldose epimerase family protein [Lentilactobacillus hilgardii]MCT3392440.1 galactose mutarotase [Lentilactobacillus hilgardii]
MSNNQTVGTIDKFDDYQGHQIDKLTLSNANNVSISVITLGSTLYELNVPDKEGGVRNLVLNFEHSQDYFENPFYICMGIGRVGGRIADGQLVVDGKQTQLPQNEGTTTLHGGPDGFNTQIWQGEIGKQDGNDVIIMHHLQKSEDDGLPGDMDATITYSLSDDNVVSMNFSAKSSEDTVFNPTQHTYFNLGKTSDIMSHQLKLNAIQALKLDDKKIPTKDRIDVEGTPYDFRKSKSLGDAINAMSNTKEKGFDDVFAVHPDAHNIIAELKDPDTNCSVAIESSRSGMILFTANSFTKDHMNFVRTNGVGHPHEGVAMEPMILPKPGQEKDFSEMTIKKDQSVSYAIKYHLSF